MVSYLPERGRHARRDSRLSGRKSRQTKGNAAGEKGEETKMRKKKKTLKSEREREKTGHEGCLDKTIQCNAKTNALWRLKFKKENQITQSGYAASVYLSTLSYASQLPFINKEQISTFFCTHEWKS